MTEYIPVSVEPGGQVANPEMRPEPHEYDELVQAVGWGSRSLDAWNDALETALGVAFARDPNTHDLVGAAMVIGNSFYRSLHDVAVRPDFQNQGIATRMGVVLASRFFEKSPESNPDLISAMLLAGSSNLPNLWQLYGGQGWRSTVRAMVRSNLSSPDPADYRIVGPGL